MSEMITDRGDILRCIRHQQISPSYMRNLPDTRGRRIVDEPRGVVSHQTGHPAVDRSQSLWRAEGTVLALHHAVYTDSLRFHRHELHLHLSSTQRGVGGSPLANISELCFCTKTNRTSPSPPFQNIVFLQCQRTLPHGKRSPTQHRQSPGEC